MEIVEPLWNKRQIATYYGVSEKTIDDWVRSGKLRVILTPGGAPRFRRPESAGSAPAGGA